MSEPRPSWWIDTTHYDVDGSVPAGHPRHWTWHPPNRRIRVVVIALATAPHGPWAVRCDEARLSYVSLETNDLKEAQRKALQMVADRLAEIVELVREAAR